MKKQITTEEAKRLAKLSMLEFDDSELKEIEAHLSKMLGYFSTLDSVDVSEVPPTAHILPAVNVLRDDEVVKSMPTEDLIANAPKAEDGAYVVPRVVE